MQFSNFLSSRAAAVALGLAALGAAGAAQARDHVSWSVGINAAPGVSVGVGNVRPMYVQPAPVYVQPQPVYVQPQAVYVQPQTIYSVPQVQYTQPQVVYPAGAIVQQPVYVQRVAPIYYRGGYDHHHGRGHSRHWR
jgi:hypothetical protein